MPTYEPASGTNNSGVTIGAYIADLATRQQTLEAYWARTRKVAQWMTVEEKASWNAMYLTHLARIAQLGEYFQAAGETQAFRPKPIGCFTSVTPGCPTTASLREAMARLPPITTMQPTFSANNTDTAMQPAQAFGPLVWAAIYVGGIVITALLATAVAARIAGADVVALFVTDRTAIEQYKLALESAKERGEPIPDPNPPTPFSWKWALGIAATIAVVGGGYYWWKHPEKVGRMIDEGKKKIAATASASAEGSEA